MTCLLQVELDLANKSNFQCFPLAVLLLIYPISHFHYFIEGDSGLNNVYFYNDSNVIQKA